MNGALSSLGLTRDVKTPSSKAAKGRMHMFLHEHIEKAKDALRGGGSHGNTRKQSMLAHVEMQLKDMRDF